MSRLCGPNKPVVCSVCLQPPMLDHSLEYVDFEASFDGPVVDDPRGPFKTSVDNIIVCEQCVRGAANLLGLVDEDSLRVEIEDQAGQIEQLRAEVKAKDKAISDLTYTVGTMMDHPVKRTVGAPTLRGPEDREDEMKEYRKKRANAGKVSKGKKRAAAKK